MKKYQQSMKWMKAKITDNNEEENIQLKEAVKQQMAMNEETKTDVKKRENVMRDVKGK